jgi:MraZ protein
MFRGRYQHTIDPKGRLSVPSKFRDAMAQYGEALVVVPNEHSLEVHPLEEWQRMEEKLNAQSAFAREVRET